MKNPLRISMMITAAAMLLPLAAAAADPGWLDLTPRLEKWFVVEADKGADLRLHTLNSPRNDGMITQYREVLRDGEVISSRSMVYSNDGGDILYHGDPDVGLFTEPVLWVDAPLEIGKSWTDLEISIDKNGEAALTHFVFAVIEEAVVTCPAGTFPCHRVFVATINGDGAEEVGSFWYNGVCGLIRCAVEGEQIFALQKAQVLDGPDDPDRDRDRPPTDGDLSGLKSVPNPFNPSTSLTFELGSPVAVHVDVYDVSGRLVRSLVRGDLMAAGSRRVTWNGLDDGGRPVASGTYVFRLRAGNTVATDQLTLVR